MSTNLIDDMTEEESKSLLNDISDIFSIGGKARTASTILTNIQNTVRRAHCLSKIESYFTTAAVDEDGEVYEQDLLCWGENPEEYIETFKRVIKTK